MKFVDLFAGAGGTTCGAVQAGAEPVLAINHWERAIETHSANYPECLHLCQRIEHVDPEDYTHLGIDLLFASPPCTHHSNARGGKPRSDQSRSCPWTLLRWIDVLRPAWVVVENVPEFAQWGPLGQSGKPLKRLKGHSFHGWSQAIQWMGYHLETRKLKASDYGDATTRERLFVIAGRDWPEIPWPEPSTWRTACNQFLDLSLPMRDLKQKPLKEKTMQRIAEGSQVYQDSHWILKYYGSGGRSSFYRPLPTITTRDRFALITDGGTHFRMLQPDELKGCQGFPESYILTGTREEQVKQIGNSVCPGTARAITHSLMGAM